MIDINNIGKTLSGTEDVKQSWGIILNTVKGSDPLRPEFGCDIFNYIDKPITMIQGLSSVITDLEKWEPRSTVNQVKVTTQERCIVLEIIGTYIETGAFMRAMISLLNLVVDEKKIIHSYSESYNLTQFK